MKKPKKTRKVWALHFGTGGMYSMTHDAAKHLDTPCGRVCRWARNGRCLGFKYGGERGCYDISRKTGKECVRYRATLTLEERK